MIRHGETEANAAEIMAGSMDSPLNQTGIKQAHAVKNIIKHILGQNSCGIILPKTKLIIRQ